MTTTTCQPTDPASGVGRRSRRAAYVRSAIVAGGLVELAAHVGTGPIRHALTGLTASTVLLALGLGAVGTVASATRWRAVARGVGLEVPAAAAAAAVYRATLLNSVLPGGFLGDLDRAWLAHQHARRHRHPDPERAARVVVLERAAGQATVLTAALAVVVATAPAAAPTLLPSPAAVSATAIGAATVAVGGVAVLAVTVRRRTTAGAIWIGRVRRQVAALIAELRGGMLTLRTAAVVVASSLIGFAALLATFALAADVAELPVPLSQLLPLCTIGLVAMAVPANIGGWGPREIAIATAFAAAGLGAPTGLAISVVYGMLSLLGCLPGALVLALSACPARAGRAHTPDPGRCRARVGRDRRRR